MARHGTEWIPSSSAGSVSTKFPTTYAAHARIVRAHDRLHRDKIPRWNFEKFPQADRTLTTQMKSVGEAMSIGRTFKESFLKGIRSLELGEEGRLLTQPGEEEDDATLREKLVVPNDRRMWACSGARRGWTVDSCTS